LANKKRSATKKLFEAVAPSDALEKNAAELSDGPAATAAPALQPAPAKPSAGEKPAIFLLDSMSFIFRAYHAMARQKGMSTRTGIPTAATYVFVNMLRKLRDDFHPLYLAAVFDVGAPTLRKKQAEQITAIRKFDSRTQSFQDVVYEGYKANRKEMPADLAMQLPYIRRALEVYRIPILQAPGYEADDVIGTLARQAAELDHPVFIVSSDKDMLQLVSGRICVLNPPKDNLICDPAKVEEILGVPPEQVVDVMALRGDAIDNVPGAPGIGDKGSVELIKRFGSLEATLEHAAEIEKKTYRESLLENRDVVRLSKELVTIDARVPVTLELELMAAQEPDAAAARELFSELEFTSLIKEFLPAVDTTTTEYREANSEGELAEALQAMAPGGALAVALQSPATMASPTGGDWPAHKHAAGVDAVSTAGLEASATDVDEEEEPEEEPSPSAQLTLGSGGGAPPVAGSRGRLERVAVSAQAGVVFTVALASPAGEKLKAVLADPSVPKAIHDYKSAIHVLEAELDAISSRMGPAALPPQQAKAGPAALESRATLAGVRDDAMLFSYLLDPTYSSHTLTEIALRRFNLKLSADAAERESSPGRALADAAATTFRVCRALRDEVEQAGLMPVYEQIDLPLVPVLARMEQAGVKLDCAALAEMSRRLETECTRKTREIHEQAGEVFNVNSPRQLGQVLFERLALPKPVKYGKGRTVSTAIDVLEALAEQHAVPRLMLEYRQLAKLKSTYVDALPALLNPATQRVHTTFDQTTAATGRLSSRNPNLQNIPIRSELGREIRAAFVAEPGYVLLSADYSQVELRLLAHFSQDPLLLEAFQRGDDIHTLTAAEVFGVPPLLVTPEQRRRAKAINFGIPYGLSPFGLAQQLGIDKGDAKRYIDTYFERYRGVRAWLDATVERARAEQKVSTLLGRVRPIPDINSRNANLRGFAERTAVNTPLQGTAADLIKIAMIRLDAEMRARRLQSRMTLQVHDELVFEVPEAELDTMRALVRRHMENVHPLRVPLLIEIGVGQNWRDLN
jgi:DNA polymerase-1